MTFFDSACSAGSTPSRYPGHFKTTYRIAILGIAACIVTTTGCRSNCPANGKCHPRAIHSAAYHASPITAPQPYQETVDSPLYQVAPADQEILGGCGLATSDSCPIGQPVEVAPVPMQFSQPMEYDAGRPAIESEPDLMELDETQLADPMEI